jgi:hypothetical protein
MDNDHWAVYSLGKVTRPDEQTDEVPAAEVLGADRQTDKLARLLSLC